MGACVQTMKISITEQLNFKENDFLQEKEKKGSNFG